MHRASVRPINGQAAKAARQFGADLVVVSEAQALALPAGRQVDLTLCGSGPRPLLSPTA